MGDLSYGEILSGQPGAWLVKNICSACNHKSAEIELILKFKPISRTCFVFLKASSVHDLWSVSVFIMMTANKNGEFRRIFSLSDNESISGRTVHQ